MMAKAARCTAAVRSVVPRIMACRRAKLMTSGVASIHGNQDTSSVPKISASVLLTHRMHEEHRLTRVE